MDIPSKRKELTELVDNIKEHSDRLTISHTLPALELSVLLSKISRLYEEVVILKHEISIMEYSEVENLMNTPREQKEEAKVEVAQEKEEERTENFETVEDLVSKDEDAGIVENENLPNQESQKREEVKEEASKSIENEDSDEKPETNEFPNKEIIGMSPYEIDFQDLNSKLSAKEDKSVVDQLQAQPIADLTTAIGLNERYLYANELFDGNMDEFREALKSLNAFDSLEEALSYFDSELKSNYNWSDGNELVSSLKLLVRRRFK